MRRNRITREESTDIKHKDRNNARLRAIEDAISKQNMITKGHASSVKSMQTNHDNNTQRAQETVLSHIFYKYPKHSIRMLQT